LLFYPFLLATVLRGFASDYYLVSSNGQLAMGGRWWSIRPSSNQKQNLEGLWPKEKGKITKNGQQNATEKDKD
jgi:hypothetical protein